MKLKDWIRNNYLVKDIVPLVSAVFVAFSLLLIVILYSYTESLTELEKVIVLQGNESVKMKINSELMELARTRTRLTSKLLDTEDVFEQDEINMKLDVYASRFAIRRSQFQELQVSHAEKEIFEKQNSIIPVILPAQRKAVVLAMSDDKDKKKKSERILYNVVLPGQGQLVELFSQMIEHEQHAIDVLSKNSQQAIVAMKKEITRLIIYSLFVIVLLALIVVSHIKRIQKALLESHADLENTVELRTKELNEAMHVAEHAASVKSEFLATMSHEIRTPMNGVLGMAQLLKNTNMDSTQKYYLDTILNSSEHLLSIINDILDLSKLDADKVILENIPFDFKKMCRNVVKILEPQCNEKNIDLIIEYVDDECRYFSGDPSRLNQILFNLLGNAIKFTDSGYVKLIVKCLSYDQQLANLRVTIEDTGIGVDENVQGNIFQSFAQADASTTRQYGGAGLGLAICNQLLKLMGGELAMISDYGKGSTFYFSITLRLLDADQLSEITHTKADAETDSNTANQFDGHVLLVEDVKVNQMIAEAMLKELGVSVDIAEDGLQAIECFNKNKYDLIFMDCRMPNLDGYEATKQIREIENNKVHTPILALTANVTEEDQTRCLSHGMDDLIKKPYQMNELADALLKWLKD